MSDNIVNISKDNKEIKIEFFTNKNIDELPFCDIIEELKSFGRGDGYSSVHKPFKIGSSYVFSKNPEEYAEQLYDDACKNKTGIYVTFSSESKSESKSNLGTSYAFEVIKFKSEDPHHWYIAAYCKKDCNLLDDLNLLLDRIVDL